MQDNKVATNIYSILDNELARMHALLQVYLGLPPEPPPQSKYHNYTPYPQTDVPEIYKRIVAIQDTVIKAAINVDPAIQEKVAELALTGEAK